jgi:hypothetical protein
MHKDGFSLKGNTHRLLCMHKCSFFLLKIYRGTIIGLFMHKELFSLKRNTYRLLCMHKCSLFFMKLNRGTIIGLFMHKEGFSLNATLIDFFVCTSVVSYCWKVIEKLFLAFPCTSKDFHLARMRTMFWWVLIICISVLPHFTPNEI